MDAMVPHVLPGRARPRIIRHLFALGVFGWLGLVAGALVATVVVSFVMWARADLPADWFEFLDVAKKRDITRADLRRRERLHDDWPAVPESALEPALHTAMARSNRLRRSHRHPATILSP
jgi:hypothetical protein